MAGLPRRRHSPSEERVGFNWALALLARNTFLDTLNLAFTGCVHDGNVPG